MMYGSEVMVNNNDFIVVTVRKFTVQNQSTLSHFVKVHS